MQYIVALDQGTTSSRAIVFDEAGHIVAAQGREFRQIYPRPGWVEHDPMDILHSQVEALRAAVEASGVDVRNIAAIGITNQRETTLMWDRQTGETICGAIVWQCRRTAPLVERHLREGMEAADKIVNTPRDGRDKPLTAQRIKEIRVETFGQAYPVSKL